jgi:dihydrofolate synthase/folylpolyglutamate synthase
MIAKANELYEKLFNESRGPIKKGVHRISELIFEKKLEPILQVPSIIISGSNGKGTTSHLIELFLRAQGLKTGLFTSPHFLSPCERICIQGLPISEEDFLKSFDRLYPFSKNSQIDASFFEIISLLAFDYFLKEKVDVIVAEVGLGGRFDSINVLNPAISALTSISCEHVNYFGKSLFDIAYDKSFVGRRNKSLFIPKLQKLAREGIKKAKDIIGFNLVSSSSKESSSDSLLEFSSHTASSHYYSENLKMAFLLVKEFLKQKQRTIDVKSISKALKNFKLPGRIDKRRVIGKDVLFDVAHNEESLSHLDRRLFTLKELDNEYCLVLAFLKDKEFHLQSKKFFKNCKTLYFIEFDHPRALTLSDYKSWDFLKFDKKRQIHYKKLKEFDISTLKGKIIFTGSFAFIAELFKKYKINVFEK